MKVLFFSAANQRQDENWDYTVNEWGEEKAIRYIERLHKTIAEVAAGTFVRRQLAHVKLSGIYFIRYGHHFIFFRELPENRSK